MTGEFTAQPAQREAIRLLLGLAGGTGSGKTYSALRLASGVAGGERFGLIDTENGRALMYADEFAFDHVRFDPPFTPARYLEAITANAHYPVLVVDSASHEWAGDGGVLDMADAELERMGGRDSARMAQWIKPKAEHKRFVHEGLLRLPCHVILCFRAEPKVEMRKDDKGKWEVVPKPTLTGLDGWIPIAEKNLPFELTLSFLLMADAPGVPRPIKLPARLRPLVPLDSPLAEDSGKGLAAWAQGDAAPAIDSPRDTPEPLTKTQGKALDSVRTKIGDRVNDATIWARVCDRRREPATGNPDWEEIRDALSADEATWLHAYMSEYLAKLSPVPS